MSLLPGGDSFAGTIRQKMSDGLILSEEIYGPDARLPPHAHEQAYVSIVLRGGFREHAADVERWVGPHDVSFHPARIEHDMTIGPEGAWTYCIELGTHWQGDHDWLGKLRTGIAAAYSLGMWRLYHELRARPSPDASLLRRTLDDILRPRLHERAPHQGPVWLPDVLWLIHNGYDRRVTVRGLAESVGVHPFYLGSTFKAQVGRSVLEYLRALRTAQCARRLQFSRASLVEIAYDTGFADQSHMTRVFHAATGWTPAAFRRDLGIDGALTGREPTPPGS